MKREISFLLLLRVEYFDGSKSSEVCYLPKI